MCNNVYIDKDTCIHIYVWSTKCVYKCIQCIPVFIMSYKCRNVDNMTCNSNRCAFLIITGSALSEVMHPYIAVIGMFFCMRTCFRDKVVINHNIS